MDYQGKNCTPIKPGQRLAVLRYALLVAAGILIGVSLGLFIFNLRWNEEKAPGAGGTVLYKKDQAVSLDSRGYSYSGIYIHMKKDTVINLLGSPDSIMSIHPDSPHVITMDYGDIKIDVYDKYGEGYVGEGVYMISFFSEETASPKGIRIGGSMQKLLELHGKPDFQFDSGDGSKTTIGYMDQQDWTVGSSLFFVLENDSVKHWGIIRTADLND